MRVRPEAALAARGALGGCHMRGRQLTVEAPIPLPPTYTPTQARGRGALSLVPPPKAACGAVCKARVKLWCTRHVGVPALVTTPPELRRSTTDTKVLSAAVAEVHLQEANLKH